MINYIYYEKLIKSYNSLLELNSGLGHGNSIAGGAYSLNSNNMNVNSLEQQHFNNLLMEPMLISNSN
jgi:hypothetical protein